MESFAGDLPVKKHIAKAEEVFIPENDRWIAAPAREHGLTLVSRDEHFKQIDELKRMER